jgi:hypothetical protein
MRYILIQVNESIAKLVTLMVKDFNKVIMKFMFSKLFVHFTILFNIYINECNAKLITLMVQGFKVYVKFTT